MDQQHTPMDLTYKGYPKMMEIQTQWISTHPFKVLWQYEYTILYRPTVQEPMITGTVTDSGSVLTGLLGYSSELIYRAGEL